MHYLAYGGRGGGCIGGGMPAKCGGCGGILGGSGIPGLRKIYRRGKNISFISNTQNENSNLFFRIYDLQSYVGGGGGTKAGGGGIIGCGGIICGIIGTGASAKS